MKDILQIGIPSVIGIVLAILSYKLGKRSKKYDALLPKAIPIAEQIIDLLQKIESRYKYLKEFFKLNFRQFHNIDEMVDSFEGHGDLYEQEKNDIQTMMQQRVDLLNLCHSARLYLDNNILSNIEKYIEVGNFGFSSAVGFDDFYKNFWLNLLKEENEKYRITLYNDTMKYCQKLLPK
jgi:hypothetical protein